MSVHKEGPRSVFLVFVLSNVIVRFIVLVRLLCSLSVSFQVTNDFNLCREGLDQKVQLYVLS